MPMPCKGAVLRGATAAQVRLAGVFALAAGPALPLLPTILLLAPRSRHLEQHDMVDAGDEPRASLLPQTELPPPLPPLLPLTPAWPASAR